MNQVQGHTQECSFQFNTVSYGVEVREHTPGAQRSGARVSAVFWSFLSVVFDFRNRFGVLVWFFLCSPNPQHSIVFSKHSRNLDIHIEQSLLTISQCIFFSSLIDPDQPQEHQNYYIGGLQLIKRTRPLASCSTALSTNNFLLARSS